MAFPVVVVAVGVASVLAGLRIQGKIGLYVMLAGLAIMIALGFGLVSALRARRPPIEGPRLERDAHPALWRMIDDLAAQVKTRPPDEIVLIGEINAAVSEDARFLGLRPGRRTMLIGLPLLAAMSVSELRSVLAHELGHYSGGHTRLLALTYRGTQTLAFTVDRLDGGPARALLSAYSKLYLLVARSANRRQELQADEASVLAAGSRTAAAALRKIATLSPLWKDYAERYLSLGAAARRTPPVLLGFRSYLDHPVQRDWVLEYAEEVIDGETLSKYDSHPPTKRRIAALAGVPDNPVKPDARPGWSLLGAPKVDVPEAELGVLIRDVGPRADWDEVVKRAGRASVAEGAKLLTSAGLESRLAPRGTIGEVVRVLRDGDAEALARPLRAPSREEGLELLTELFADTVTAAMIDNGVAAHRLNWGGDWALCLGDGEPFDVVELVAPAVRGPRAVDELVHNLQLLNVPAAYFCKQEPQPEPDPAEARMLGLFTALKAKRKLYDLIVCDTEVVMLPMARSVLVRRGLAGLLGARGVSDRKRIRKLRERGLDELRAEPGARRIPFADIVAGGFPRRKLTVYLTLELAGGEVLELAMTGNTEDFGTAHDELKAFFGSLKA
ncbi:M48 family metalloprotease [Amycolatopsis sp. QT-25]|uniref:M48 family metallopeptidase n=1 Tax=Amycolatopsis sp. QT-25 TaxID=3034022 RepID=UPI0023EAA887|nr:M48 family metallopeptidase [Amycolatopsis sp. QT-25]WET81422.1 M48 family metalloprotease [Amycolatopsis sp. QT-25]